MLIPYARYDMNARKRLSLGRTNVSMIAGMQVKQVRNGWMMMIAGENITKGLLLPEIG